MSELILKDAVYQIVGGATEVHSLLGAGFLEAVYQEAIEIELRARKVGFESQKSLPIAYKGVVLAKYCVADLICDGPVLVETKAMEKPTTREEAQLLSYLRATGIKVGLLLKLGLHKALEWKRMVL